MTNFDDLKQIAKDTMETIADKSVELYKIAEEKTKVLARTTKLTTEIALEKGNIRRFYRELGQLYFEQHGTSPEPAFEPGCTAITACLLVIAEKQKEIDDLKASGADIDDVVDDVLDDDDEDDIDTSQKTSSVSETVWDAEDDMQEGGKSTPPEFKL
ncbi:hypothetical protein IZU99_06025 [Oscillospiraceae bacterium CM]|nr:hypothetical protein IZU99_06025 [Oscillospiraceae bacterium CM]